MQKNSIVKNDSYRVTRLCSLMLFGLLLCLPVVHATKTYQKPADYLKAKFQGKPPAASFVTISADMKNRISKMNGYSYRQSRVRFWTKGETSVWILEDIGKTKPITTAYTIKGGKIEEVKVLIYRESHGDEVERTFFTKQFNKASMKSSLRLSKRPRNIAGATLSVRSLTRMARVALFLDNQSKAK